MGNTCSKSILKVYSRDLRVILEHFMRLFFKLSMRFGYYFVFVFIFWVTNDIFHQINFYRTPYIEIEVKLASK